MTQELDNKPIPMEIAVQLCNEIRQEAEVNWQTAAASWCFSCQQQAGGDPAKRGILRLPGNRGCHLVNQRYVTSRSMK